MRYIFRSQAVGGWVKGHYLQLAIFNLLIGLMVLLRTAGYFHPFFVLSINFIFFISFVLSIVLLGAKSMSMFLIAIIFWLLAGFFKIVNVDIWAERTAIYVFQAIFLGTSLLVVEYLKK